MNDDIKEAKETSIRDYLETRGIKTEVIGNRARARSPFSRDTNPSFLVYPNNTFYDWSTGRSGDIIDLVRQLEGCTFTRALEYLRKGQYAKFEPREREETKDVKLFDYKSYITTRPDEVEAIRQYARSRGITQGYENGIFFTREVGGSGKETWIRHPSIGFVHRDKDLQICGIKLRDINPKAQPRFRAKGKLGWHLLESSLPVGYQKETVFVVEGETNANSLREYLSKTVWKVHIISPGAVTASLGLELPEKYSKLSKKLIIDYDGSEKLYKERLKLYEHLNAEPIKLMLPKGEDINSLYMAGKMYLIDHLL